MDINPGGNVNSSRGARWVCPNDRQLALRAKLRTGWSVKTGSLDSWSDYSYSSSYPGSSDGGSASFVLTEDERQAIIQVIQRAEALDLSEQERVGKLVERLENMKRNVNIVTTTRSSEKRNCGSRCSNGMRCVCSCALCGEKFAVLGAGPSLCRDCRKYICQKCGIETVAAGNMLPQSGSSTSPTTSVPGFLQRSSNNMQKHFLCRICAETREIWKKSGAWFIKGMPKYVLPEKKDRGRGRVGSRTSCWTLNSVKPLEQDQDSSSDDDAHRRLASKSLMVPSNDGNISTKEQQRSHSTSPHNPGHSSTSFTPVYRRESSCPEESMGMTTSATTDRRSSSQLTDSGDSYSQRHLSSSSSKMSIRSRSSRSINSSQTGLRRSSVGDGKESKDGSSDQLSSGIQVHPLRKDSMTIVTLANNSNSSWNQPQQYQRQQQQQQQQQEQQQQQQQAVFEKNVNYEKNCYWDQESIPASNQRRQTQSGLVNETEFSSMGTSQSYGTLEVSLRYDPAAQSLQCKVERARGLRPMDIHGLADPFCKLNVLPVKSNNIFITRLRTKTVHKTCDPEFNETLTFYRITESDMTNDRALHILILQDDPVDQDFLGEAKFPLHELQPYQTKHYNVFLQGRYTVDREEEVWGDGGNIRGRIQLTLSYNTRRRALLVTVQCATNLLPMDSNGFSDPFVRLCLIKDTKDNRQMLQQQQLQQQQHRQSGQRTSKKSNKKITTSQKNVQNTSVKWKTLNPEWNEEFAFETRLTDLTGLMLSLSVWDKDFGKSNDYLGGLTLSCNSKGARLRHWVDAIKFPDHRHQAWHNLIDSTVPTE